MTASPTTPLCPPHSMAATATTRSQVEAADVIYGRASADTLVGGLGSDRIYGDGGRDKLFGGGGNDRLHGGTSADSLYGQNGSDELYGEGGDDRLFDDYPVGLDTLHGGPGNDSFVTRDGLVDQVFGDGGADTATADNADVLTSVETRVTRRCETQNRGRVALFQNE